MSIIDDIVDRTKVEVKKRRKELPEKELRKRLKDREDGRPFAEATLLRAGHAFQQATDFHRRAPVLRDGATSTSAGAAGQATAGDAA